MRDEILTIGEGEASLLSLPDEIVELVVQKLDDGMDWIRFSLTCRRLRKIVQDGMQGVPKPDRQVMVTKARARRHLCSPLQCPDKLAGFGTKHTNKVTGIRAMNYMNDHYHVHMPFDMEELVTYRRVTWGCRMIMGVSLQKEIRFSDTSIPMQYMTPIILACLANPSPTLVYDFSFEKMCLRNLMFCVFKDNRDMRGLLGRAPQLRVDIAPPYLRRWRKLQDLMSCLAEGFREEGVLLQLVGGCVEFFRDPANAQMVGKVDATFINDDGVWKKGVPLTAVVQSSRVGSDGFEVFYKCVEE